MSDKKNYYYNRELSWMDFNARVLEEAQKKDNPLMERLRFLAITGSNLDEFFMVRVAGVKSQVASNYTKPDDSGMTPKELLSALDKKAHGEVQTFICEHRERAAAVYGERRQHGEQHAVKILVRKGSLLVRELFQRAELDFRLLFEDRQNRAV